MKCAFNEYVLIHTCVKTDIYSELGYLRSRNQKDGESGEFEQELYHK